MRFKAKKLFLVYLKSYLNVYRINHPFILYSFIFIFKTNLQSSKKDLKKWMNFKLIKSLIDFTCIIFFPYLYDLRDKCKYNTFLIAFSYIKLFNNNNIKSKQKVTNTDAPIIHAISKVFLRLYKHLFRRKYFPFLSPTNQYIDQIYNTLIICSTAYIIISPDYF